MKLLSYLVPGSLAVIAVVGSLSLAAPVLSQTTASDQSNATANAVNPDRMRAHVQARLERMAKRLNIDASQQSAWDSYANMVQGLIGAGMQRPATDADAATIARFRADVAAEHARKLAQLADATATLQQALNPEQRKVLAELVRHPENGRFSHHEHNRG
jgi:hypothetical protein